MSQCTLFVVVLHVVSLYFNSFVRASEKQDENLDEIPYCPRLNVSLNKVDKVIIILQTYRKVIRFTYI